MYENISRREGEVKGFLDYMHVKMPLIQDGRTVGSDRVWLRQTRSASEKLSASATRPPTGRKAPQA